MQQLHSQETRLDSAYELLAGEFHEAAHSLHPDHPLSWHEEAPQCPMVEVVAELIAAEPDHRMLFTMLWALLAAAEEGSTIAAKALDGIAHEYASAYLRPLVRVGAFNE